LSGPAYVALQGQASSAIRYVWSSGIAEYSTPGLDAALPSLRIIQFVPPAAGGATFGVASTPAAALPAAFVVWDTPTNFDSGLSFLAATAGTAGNSLTLAFAADSVTGVTINRVGTAFTIHYQDGVSTEDEVATAVGLLAGPDRLFVLDRNDVPAQVLTLANEFTAAPFSGGAEAVGAMRFPEGTLGYPAFITPGIPNNLFVQFGLGWDYGNVTVYGTNQFDAVISELFVASPANQVVGVKIFKTLTSAVCVNDATGVSGAQGAIGFGQKMGLPIASFATTSLLLINDQFFPHTIDTTYPSCATTLQSDGSYTYKFLVMAYV
jgi:hypothetical protein